jgi:hypothetical protein
MKFCQQCGQTLSILAHSSSDYCTECTAAPEKSPAENIQVDQPPDIYSAFFTCTDGKIVLKSKEGWILWSGSAENEHCLQTIIDRADAILKIRSKRKK